MSYYRPTSGPPTRGGSAPQFQQQPPQIPGGGLYPNPMLMQQPQLGFMNPQLLNPYNNNNNNNNNNNSGNNGGFNNMNMNMNMGVFQGLQQPFQPQQRGFCPPNSGQFGGWQQNQGQQLGGLTLNPLQVAALNQLVGVVNQAAQSMLPQNAGFVGLQQQQQQQQGGFSQQLPLIPQQFQNVPVVPWNPAAPQNNQPWNLQGNMQGLQSNTGHNQNKMLLKTPPKEASNWKSKKLNGHQVHNSKGKLQSSNSNKGKGIKQADNENSANKTKGEKRRPLFLLYTKKEVEKWRQDRKKNYPTKDNVQKKLLPKQPSIDGTDEDAKLRRQQLKEVIAKQVELGFEVPEIPPHYLSDSEEQFNSKDSKKRPRDQKKSNKRGRGRFEKTRRLALQRSTEDDGSGGGQKQFATNQKDDDKTPSSRQPTLLQKLLGTDMKRDKNRLLQAFRFMVMNSFFMDQTEKRLHFPEVVVEEEGEITD